MIFLDALQNYRRYGSLSTTQDILKAFAIIIMMVDHVGYVFYPDELWWRAVGRIGFPIWFFLAGYAKPSRPPYLILQLCALMVLTDYCVGERLFPINALLSIFCCRLFIASQLVQQPLTPVNWAFIMLLVVVFAIPSLVIFEYGPQALLFALCGYYCRALRHHVLSHVTQAFSFIVFILMQTDGFQFNLAQWVFMTVGSGIVTLYLARFSIKPIEYAAGLGFTRPVINFVSRNSHYVYALHFIAFLALREWWHHVAP